MVSRESSADLQQWRALLQEDRQSFREELRQELREHLTEAPSLERVFSGPVGNSRMPPDLLRSSAKMMFLFFFGDGRIEGADWKMETAVFCFLPFFPFSLSVFRLKN